MRALEGMPLREALEETKRILRTKDRHQKTLNAPLMAEALAASGVEAIPCRWLDEVELRKEIESIADDLFEFPTWRIGEYGGMTMTGYGNGIRDGDPDGEPIRAGSINQYPAEPVAVV